MFNEIDKESDGEIYYREMVSHLDSLNNDLDQENNPQVNLVAKLSDLTGLAKDKKQFDLYTKSFLQFKSKFY